MKKYRITVFILLLMVYPIFGQDDADDQAFTQAAQVGRGIVRQVMWSPQGDEIAVVTSRGVWLYDAMHLRDNPRLFTPTNLDMGLTATLAIAPTWDFVAGVNTSGQVTVWNLSSGDVVFTSDDSMLQQQHLAYSPDGRLMLAAQYNSWKVWDTASDMLAGGSDYAEIDERFRPDGAPEVTAVGFSADGTRYGIATTDTRSDEVNSITYILDSQTHDLLAIEGAFEIGEVVLMEALALNIGLVYEVEGISLDTDQSGRTETSFNILSLYMVDESGHRFVTALPTDRRNSSFESLRNTIAISPDETQIVITDRAGAIRVWNIQQATETPPCLVTLPTGSTSGSEPIDHNILGLFSLTCDARWSARVAFNRTHVPQTNVLTTSRTNYQDNAYYSADNRWRLIEPDRENQAFRLESLETDAVTELEVLYPDAQIRSVIFTSDRRYVIVAFTTHYLVGVGDTVIRVWQMDGDIVTPEPVVTLIGHNDRITSLALSQNEQLLVTASWDGTARVWDTMMWELVAVLEHDTLLESSAFGDDDDTILTAGRDGIVYIWRRE